MSEIEQLVKELEEFEDDERYALIDGHIATSPFPEYPGKLIFKKKFSGKLYKAYLSSQKAALEDEDINDVWTGWWETFLAVEPSIRVDGMSLDFDENDMLLNRWGVAMLMRWVNPFLTSSPWRKPSGPGTEQTEKS